MQFGFRTNTIKGKSTMQDDELQYIQQKIQCALRMLDEEDDYLLENSLNERYISHKFAEKLARVFIGYDVDCEYNKNIDQNNQPKAIYLDREDLKKDLKARGKYLYKKLNTKEKMKNISEKEFLRKCIYPDIIIHIRGTLKNEIIFEIKKKSNNDEDAKEFDIYKLIKYTSSAKLELKYRFGVYIELDDGVKENNGVRHHYTIFFKDGGITNEKYI